MSKETQKIVYPIAGALIGALLGVGVGEVFFMMVDDGDMFGGIVRVFCWVVGMITAMIIGFFVGVKLFKLKHK